MEHHESAVQRRPCDGVPRNRLHPDFPPELQVRSDNLGTEHNQIIQIYCAIDTSLGVKTTNYS